MKIEREAMKCNPNLRPFLRKTINNKLLYLTMEEYRLQYLEKKVPLSTDEEFDYGGCGCAVD